MLLCGRAMQARCTSAQPRGACLRLFSCAMLCCALLRVALCPCQRACSIKLGLPARAAGPRIFTASTAERPGLQTGDVVAFLSEEARAGPRCALTPVLQRARLPGLPGQGCSPGARALAALTQARRPVRAAARRAARLVCAGVVSGSVRTRSTHSGAAPCQGGVYAVVQEGAEAGDPGARHYSFQPTALPAGADARAAHLEVVRQVAPRALLATAGARAPARELCCLPQPRLTVRAALPHDDPSKRLRRPDAGSATCSCARAAALAAQPLPGPASRRHSMQRRKRFASLDLVAGRVAGLPRGGRGRPLPAGAAARRRPARLLQRQPGHVGAVGAGRRRPRGALGAPARQPAQPPPAAGGRRASADPFTQAPRCRAGKGASVDAAEPDLY